MCYSKNCVKNCIKMHMRIEYCYQGLKIENEMKIKVLNLKKRP